MTRVVKRYANRKLYDTTKSRYVALEDIAAMVRGGEEVEVTDNETGEDLTAVTLAQIILEEERRKKNLLSLPLLREIVRYGDRLAGATNRGIEALEEMRERAERRVTEIVGENVLAGPRQRIDDLQRRVDQGLKESMARLRSTPGIGAEIERLERRVKEIETRLRRLLAGENGVEGAEGEAGGEPGARPHDDRPDRSER